MSATAERLHRARLLALRPLLRDVKDGLHAVQHPGPEQLSCKETPRHACRFFGNRAVCGDAVQHGIQKLHPGAFRQGKRVIFSLPEMQLDATGVGKLGERNLQGLCKFVWLIKS